MEPPSDGYVLALDAASPRVSVAVGRGGQVLAARDEAIARSSRRLLGMVDEALGEAGVEREALGGIAALRGPGSFTGLRVGLATALGLHMALGVPATALDTLQVLAASAAADPVLAAVDALRGEWSVQLFAGDPPLGAETSAPYPVPHGGMETLPAPEIARRLALSHPEAPRPEAVVGFGVSSLRTLPDWPAEVRLIEPGPLAPAALRLLHLLHPTWNPDLLTSPIYARPPAVTSPKPRPPAAVPAADRR